jgi:Cu(I)/Ag(I) efflux system protein CusF
MITIKGRPMFKAWLLATSLLGTHHLAVAQSQTHDAHGDRTSPAASSTPAELPWVQGEIRRIDPSARKITLRHGDIPNLEMPAMTMVFQVADVQWLSAFQVGERVRFSVTQVKGAYVVQRMEPTE